MKLFFGLLLVTVLVGIGPAMAFDDPAVAVCEFSLLRAATPPVGYQRTSVQVAGLRVHIEYELTVLNVRPKPQSIDCNFALQEGRYLLDPQVGDDVKQCMAEDFTTYPKGMRYGTPAYTAFTARQEQCQTLLQSALDIENERVENVYLPLVKAGIYPIDPADTALKPQN